MTRFFCRKCRFDLTPLFYKNYGESVKSIYPRIRAITDNLKNSGAKNVKATISKVGTVITCPKCNTQNEITLTTMEEIEEMIMEMNR